FTFFFSSRRRHTRFSRDWSSDVCSSDLTVDGEPLVLTFKEFELLRFLAMNAGQVFTREQLLNRVWGYDYFGGARTVDVHIRRIQIGRASCRERTWQRVEVEHRVSSR